MIEKAETALSLPDDEGRRSIHEVYPMLVATMPSDIKNAQISQGCGPEELGQELCGKTLHHFKVEQLIGRGGMGSVRMRIG